MWCGNRVLPLTGVASPIYDFREKDHLTRYNYRKRRKKCFNLVELKSFVLNFLSQR